LLFGCADIAADARERGRGIENALSAGLLVGNRVVSEIAGDDLREPFPGGFQELACAFDCRNPSLISRSFAHMPVRDVTSS